MSAAAWIAIDPESVLEIHTAGHFSACACGDCDRKRLLAELKAERDPPISEREWRQVELNRAAYRRS
jgi:hypothetical protein